MSSFLMLFPVEAELIWEIGKPCVSAITFKGVKGRDLLAQGVWCKCWSTVVLYTSLKYCGAIHKSEVLWCYTQMAFSTRQIAMKGVCMSNRRETHRTMKQTAELRTLYRLLSLCQMARTCGMHGPAHMHARTHSHLPVHTHTRARARTHTCTWIYADA